MAASLSTRLMSSARHIAMGEWVGGRSIDSTLSMFVFYIFKFYMLYCYVLYFHVKCFYIYIIMFYIVHYICLYLNYIFGIL